MKKTLGIRIWGMDAELRAFTENVVTVQIAKGAVELETPRQLELGAVIGLGFREQKSRFRVISSFLKDANISRVILECTHPVCLWEQELASPDPDAPARQERRKHARLAVTGSAVIYHADGDTNTSARLVDVSSSGFYVETFAPSGVGAELKIRVSVDSFVVDLQAIVRTSHSSIGMGMEILRFESEEDRRRFADLVSGLENKA